MDKIKAKLPLYDHDTYSDLSCSGEDDLKLCPAYSDTSNIELNLETHETLKRNCQTKKELT